MTKRTEIGKILFSEKKEIQVKKNRNLNSVIALALGEIRKQLTCNLKTPLHLFVALLDLINGLQAVVRHILDLGGGRIFLALVLQGFGMDDSWPLL